MTDSEFIASEMKKVLGLERLPSRYVRSIIAYVDRTKDLPGALYTFTQFLEYGDEIDCMSCNKAPRARVEERFCVTCKKGQAIDKNLRLLFSAYKDTIYPVVREAMSSTPVTVKKSRAIKTKPPSTPRKR